MSILRTRTPQTVPATASALEPFRLMRDFLRWDPLWDYDSGSPSMAFMPSFDVKETPDAYQFKADLPGVLEASLYSLSRSKKAPESGAFSRHRRALGNW